MKGQPTVHEKAATSGVDPKQVVSWKKQALEAWPAVCSTRRGRVVRDEGTRPARLSQPLGPLKVERDWLKTTLDFPLEQRRQGVEPHHEWSRVRRQGPWLGLNRTGRYDQPVEASLENLRRMRWRDAPDTRGPL